MSICTACTAITPRTRQLVLHPNIASLRSSAESCPLCLMILQSLEKTKLISYAEEYRAHIGDKYELVNDTSVTVSVNGHYASADEKAHTLDISCGPLQREDFMDPSKTFAVASSWLRVEADEHSAAAEAVMTRPLPDNAGSESTMTFLRKCLETCVHSHEKCQIGYTREEMQHAGEADDEGGRLRAKYDEADRELPTRVIDVQSFGDGVKLVETATIGGRGCYIALSHVWGNTKHFKTESTSYEKHLADIPFEDLPRTFRDAVTVTRNLGIRYLWIDSLCIIQDSVEDWKHEASRMAGVYMNAYATIAATSSKDSNGGLFATRSKPQSVVSLPYTSSSGAETGTWTIHDNTPSWPQQVLHSVLASRAWTLQEKQLSRRTLHFASDQVTFECKERFEHETQQPGNKSGSKTVDFQTVYWVLVGFRGRPQASVNSMVAGLVNMNWSRIIEDYSTRKLTYQSDKLPALEGLARHVAALTLDTYCSGLWKTQLDNGLVWRTAPYTDVVERRGRVPGQAPTWSWASMDGRVYCASHGEAPLESGFTTGSAVDIIDVSSEGVLTLAGHIVKLQLGEKGGHGQWDWDQWVKMFKRTQHMGANPLLHGHGFVRSEDHTWVGAAAMDEAGMKQGDELEMSDVDALLVVRKTIKGVEPPDPEKEPFKETYQVIFIEKTAVEGTFRRIGMGQLFLNGDFKGLEKQQICII